MYKRQSWDNTYGQGKSSPRDLATASTFTEALGANPIEMGQWYGNPEEGKDVYKRQGEGYNEMDLIGMVLHGKGISLLPNISLLALFPVCVVPVQDLPEACTGCLAWESGGKRGEAAEHFLTFCRKHYGSATEQAFSPLIKSEER